MTASSLVRAPKVLLHDHLDGGLRPATLVELAETVGYQGLGTTDPGVVAARIRAAAQARSLAGYLEAFGHTIAVLQGPDALARAAREAVEDLAADGVVYAEVRFAPELHDRAGFDLGDVIGAVCDGLDAGETAAASGTPIVVRLIVAALRDRDRSLEVARAAAKDTSGRVVGFDLANNEVGHRASTHRTALETAAAAGLGVTVHAGEADTAAAIADALEVGAMRIGHGVAAAADIGPDGTPRPGSVLERLVAGRVPLEVCPTSNVDTGVCGSLAAHPIDALRRAGAVVTVNTDNRLMSDTTTSHELAVCVEHFGWGPRDVAAVTHAGLDAAFCDPATKAQVAARLAS